MFCCVVAVCVFSARANAALDHPIIWATKADKPRILDNIAKYAWAQSLNQSLHDHVDTKVQIHKSDPGETLSAMPALCKNMSGHNKLLTLGIESGILFYLTDKEDYAQMSADIFNAYAKILATKTPKTAAISGEIMDDGRATVPQFSLLYDFIQSFLARPSIKVYDKDSKSYVAFNMQDAQKALLNSAGNIIQEYSGPDKHGRRVSNHPVLTSPGALYPILCLDDDTERERLFNIFWEVGTNTTASFKNTLLPMLSSQGGWPESVSYSFQINIILVLNIIDRIKPEMNVIPDNKKALEGCFLYTQLLSPNKTFVRYGDSKRFNDTTLDNFRFVVDAATRRNYPYLKERAFTVLKQTYIENGGYRPRISDGGRDYVSPLELLWGYEIPESVTPRIDFKKTVLVEHAGVALQRNYVADKNELYGLCGYIGGAHYVHSHLTGIAMELYGAGDFMGPNAGLPPSLQERGIAEHTDYFRLYAGNNTVVINGQSHGIQEGCWKSDAYIFQNRTVNVASEPAHLGDAVSSEFSFATQYLEDTINNAQQQRTLSILRTSPVTAYYLDIFRSRSLGENRFHDYIYHNLGETMQVTDLDNKPIVQTDTTKYQTDVGDPVKSPGWRFFSDTKNSAAISEPVRVQFQMAAAKSTMNATFPGGADKEYTSALAPPTREALNGYSKKKTQVLVIRQKGEAWNKPFIGVFEPSIGTPAVKRVEELKTGAEVVGAKITSVVGNDTIIDYVISHDDDASVYENTADKICFEGRFGVMRVLKRPGQTSDSFILYIGQGNRIQYGSKTLTAGASKAGYFNSENGLNQKDK